MQETYWNLYWVESDDIEEDCFVIARNSRSACRVEINMNGFDPDEVRAIKITRLSQSIERRFNKKSKKSDHSWPWYAYGKSFFKAVGAQFRKIDDKEEMLLDDVVYEVDDYVPCAIYKQRNIGRKALLELKANPDLASYPYDDDDVWEGSASHLMTMLGMCLARCQQIEHYIAHSFLLGISKKQKAKYQTIKDLIEGWEKKTLGNMLACIDEAYEIEPLVKANFQLFLSLRNKLIHNLITSKQFDISTRWGQDEIFAFLVFFDVQSRIVRNAFKATFYASVEFAKLHWNEDKKIPKNILTKEQRELAGLYAAFFTPKKEAI